MKRREFITLFGGAAAAWPLAACAQQGERMRRIGVLMSVAADEPDGQAASGGISHALQELGWTDGHNVRIDVRWGAGDAERTRKYVAELVASPRTSSWPVATRRWWRCSRRPAPCRSCSPWSPTRSAPALSRA